MTWIEDKGFKRHRDRVLGTSLFWECCQQPLQLGTGLSLVKKVLQSILFRLGLVENFVVEPSSLRLVVRWCTAAGKLRLRSTINADENAVDCSACEL